MPPPQDPHLLCKERYCKKMAYNKVDTLMAQVKWSEISSALSKDGRVRLADYAEQYGVSVPTMRKMMEKKYGATVSFRRGRTGGVYPGVGFQAPLSSAAATAAAAVNYTPESLVEVSAISDDEVEKAVDRILGVEA